MSVAATNVTNQYTANGSQTLFAFTFEVLTDKNSNLMINPADIQVLTAANASSPMQVVSPSQYTINGPFAPLNPNTVQFNSAPANGTIVLLQRNKSLIQPFRFIDGAAMPASTFELALDRLTMIVQQIQFLFTALGFQGMLLSNAAPITSGLPVGSWWMVNPVAAGGFFGWVVTATGVGGGNDTYKQFAPVSF